VHLSNPDARKFPDASETTAQYALQTVATIISIAKHDAPSPFHLPFQEVSCCVSR
jgi:hypothetical protein